MAIPVNKDGKDGMERRVYVLPTELLERLRAYQAANGIASEVEAARRLLDSALQMRDSIQDVLNKLAARYREEQDLRVLARDVLVTHPLVQDISITDEEMTFKLRNAWQGMIKNDGGLFIANPGQDYMHVYHAPQPDGQAAHGGSSQGAATSDPDDEIPF